MWGFRLLLGVLLLMSCTSPTEPCPVQFVDAPVVNAQGDTTGTWEIGIAYCEGRR